MSGHMLDKQRLLDKLPLAKEQMSQMSSEEVSQALLSHLKQSQDIARDLAALYAERPYVYARVMQQLKAIMGGAKLRKLHSDVVERSKHAQQEAAAAPVEKQALRSADASKSKGSSSVAGEGPSEDVKPADKEYTISAFGKSATIKVKSEDGTHQVSCSDLGIPFLSSISGSATVANEEMSALEVKATLNAKHLEATHVSMKLTKASGYKPSGSISTNLIVPGIEKLAVKFDVGQGGSELTATLSNATVIMGDVTSTLSGTIKLADNTTVDANLDISGASGDINYAGNVKVNSDAGGVTASGDMEVSGFKFVSNTSDPVKLAVSYSGSDFSATLGGAVTLSEVTTEGGATLGLTVNSASYSTSQKFAADCTLKSKVFDVIDLTGNVKFANNSFTGGRLDLSADNFSIPKESGLISGSLSGSTGVDTSGFTGAEISGNLNLNAVGIQAALNIESMTLDPSGLLKGHVLLAQPCELGLMTIDSLDTNFDSNEGLTKLDGKVSIDHPHLKSGDGGIDIAYEGATLTANGLVRLMQTEETEMGTSTIDIEMSTGSLNATFDINLTSDVGIPDTASQLKFLAGSTANVVISDNKLNPIKFSGRYSYGSGGGGGGAAAGGGAAGGSMLKFSGDLNNCLYDLDAGIFSGSATAELDADYDIGAGNHKITLEKAGKNGTSLNVTFENSQATRVTGTVGAKAQFALSTGTLEISGQLTGADYDVAAQSFSGAGVLDLDKDFNLDVEGNLTLLGGKSSLKATVASNEISELGLDATARVTVNSEVFEGSKGVFLASIADGQLSLDTGMLTTPDAKISADGDCTLKTHDDKTKLTLAGGSSISCAIIDSSVKSILGDIQYSGTTKIFSERDLAFDGNVNLKIANVDTKPEVSGKIDVNVSADYTIDEIDGVDKIELLAGSNFELDISENTVDTITGDLNLRYQQLTSVMAPAGYKVKLTGSGLNYQVQAKIFSGQVDVAPEGDIELQSPGGTQTFTILEKGTALNSTLADNKLTELKGTAAFKAEFELGDYGKVDVKKGNASVDFNIDTGEITTFKASADVSLDLKPMEGGLIKSDNCQLEADFDQDGLVLGTFSGDIDLEIPVPDGRLKLKVSAGKGLKYSRKEGINGNINVTCAEKSKLGKVGKDAMSYEFGLSASEKGIDVLMTAGKIESISGTAGLYLEQEGGGKKDDLLQVTGDIAFVYTPKDRLKSATGKVTIARKNLATYSGETLVLEESEATITINNNKLEDLSGEVNLGLDDGGGTYIEFKSEGTFDCLSGNEFTGTVTAKVTREKELGGVKAYNLYLVPGDSTFSLSIEKNKVQEINGTLGVLTRRPDGQDFFKGSVEGTYKSALAGDGGSKLSGSGTIELCSDIEMANGAFVLAAGSKGEAKITDNDIDDMSGELIVKLKAPGDKAGGEIVVTSSGVVDVKNSMVKEFTGKASLIGKVSIMEGLTLDGLDATVTIIKNELQEITGACSMTYKKGSFEISGACTTFGWKKEDGGSDKIRFAGNLAVTAFDGKLSGKVNVDYDTFANANAAPVIDGEVEFKINEWLSGKIGLKFDGSGWDNPVLSGELKVENAELIAARKLLNFSKDLDFSTQLAVGPVPVNVSAGVGLGMNINLKQVLVNSTINLDGYKVGVDKGLPDFTAELSATSGLELEAMVAPYAKVGIGVKGFSAGVGIKGVAKLTASSGMDIKGMLKGGPAGLAGELGLGFNVAGSVTLDISPEVYADLFGKNFKYPITTWTFNLGEAFNLKWGKTFKFGDQEGETDGAKQEVMSAKASQEKSTVGHKGSVSKFANSSPAGGKEGAPKMPASSDVGQAAGAKGLEKGGGGLDALSQKMKDIENVGKALGTIGKAVSLVSGLISASSFGPIGPVVYLAIKILTGEISLSTIKTSFTDLVAGIDSLKRLIKNNSDLLMSMLPDWMVKVVNFFKTASIDSILKEVVAKVREKIEALGWPYNKILKPVVALAEKKQDQIGKIAQLFSKGGNVFKGILSILGLGFSSAIDAIKMIQQIGGEVLSVIKECIGRGHIFVEYQHVLGPDIFHWQFEIPGVFKFNGSGKLVNRGAAELMLAAFGGLGLKSKERK